MGSKQDARVDKHYHIWRLSTSFTAWFFARSWRRHGVQADVQNQFDNRADAEELVKAKYGSDQWEISRHRVLSCADRYLCPMTRGGTGS